MRILIAAAIVVPIATVGLLPAGVGAQEDSVAWRRKALRGSCDWLFGCTYSSRPRRQYYSHHSYHGTPGHWSYAPATNSYPTYAYGYGYLQQMQAPPECMPKIVEASGAPSGDEEKAMKQAMISWSAAVNEEFGEIYTDITKSRHGRSVCHHASIPDRVIDKTGSFLGYEREPLKRCKIWAQPCRPEIQRTDFSGGANERQQGEPPLPRANRFWRKQ